ncbi:UDP-N-acetylglucosamine 2-epimerase [subsurface metagenome]
MKVKENYYFTQPEIRKIDFEEKRVILVTAHRRENFGEPLRNICFALKEIIDSFPDVEIVYPVHPNPNIQKPVKRLLGEVGRIHLLEPLGYDSLVNLMNQCYLMLTDSGGIQEEAPSLGKPVLVLRAVTERPEAVTAGTVKVIGTEKENIVRETKILLENKEEYQRMARAINPYGDGKAAERIIEILLNYKKDLD